jgi:hypothetical protein
MNGLHMPKQKQILVLHYSSNSRQIHMQLCTLHGIVTPHYQCENSMTSAT